MEVTNKANISYMNESLIPPFVSRFIESTAYDYPLMLNNKGLDMKYSKIPDALKVIVLSHNRFEGEIPASIGNLKGLNVLNFSNNKLTGSISSSLGNLTAIESLDLSGNKLSGEIPAELVQLAFLAVSNISNNFLTGPIPQAKQFSSPLVHLLGTWDCVERLCQKSVQCQKPCHQTKIQNLGSNFIGT